MSFNWKEAIWALTEKKEKKETKKKVEWQGQMFELHASMPTKGDVLNTKQQSCYKFLVIIHNYANV